MKVDGNPPSAFTPRDTVEEFWDVSALDECMGRAGALRVDDFLDAFRQYLGVEGDLYVFAHARHALRSYLGALPGDRTDVWISSFNCPVVADAVVDAGRRVRMFDFTDRSGHFDWAAIGQRLDRATAAVIIPHFFGVPTDLRPVLDPAHALGVRVIEDCAHTLGGRIAGKMAGTWGDAAIFSFNYDKPISLGGGGLLLDQSGVAGPVVEARIDLDTDQEELAAFRGYLERRRAEIGRPRGSLVQRIRRELRRRCMPGTSLGTFPVSGVGPLRAALGLWQLERYDAVMKIRNEHAGSLAECAGFAWPVSPEVSPAWLKQKVMPADRDGTTRVALDMHAKGLRVGRFNWPKTVEEHLQLSLPAPHAEAWAHHALDMPIHQNLTEQDLAALRAALMELSS